MDGLEMWDGGGAHLNVQSNTAALFPGLPLTHYTQEKYLKVFNN